jgi:hypothetical protein
MPRCPGELTRWPVPVPSRVSKANVITASPISSSAWVLVLAMVSQAWW